MPANSPSEVCIGRSDDPAMSDVPLKEFVERALVAERELRVMQFGEFEKSINKAREVIDVRLAGMNELREQITRERGQFVIREVFDRAHEVLDSRTRSLENSRSNLEGKMWMIGAAIMLANFIMFSISWFKK